jgi:hypothetical protein
MHDGIRCGAGTSEGREALLGKNPGSNSGLPQEAEGKTDHLPEILK